MQQLSQQGGTERGPDRGRSLHYCQGCRCQPLLLTLVVFTLVTCMWKQAQLAVQTLTSMGTVGVRQVIEQAVIDQAVCWPPNR